MEFRSYRDADGYLRDPSLLLDGPIVPGTLVTKVPVVSTINLRFGVIVGVHDGQVDIMWNRWSEDPTITDGSLRQRLGIPNARQRKKAKWEARKLARAASESAPNPVVRSQP